MKDYPVYYLANLLIHEQTHATILEKYNSYFKTDIYKRIPERQINNAFLATYLNYSSDLKLFYDLYEKCSFDLKKVINVVMAVEDYDGDPFEYLREYVVSK